MKINLLALAFFASFTSYVFGTTSKEIRECPAFWRSDASVHQGRIIWLTQNMTLSNAQSLDDAPCWVSSNGESGKIKLIFAIPLEDLKDVNPTENITFQIEMFGSTDDPSYTCDAQLGCTHINENMLVFKELENATIKNLPTDPLQVTFQKSNIRLMTHVSKTRENLLKQRQIYLIAKELNGLYWSQENPTEGFTEIYQKATARIEEKYGSEAFNAFLNFIENYESPDLTYCSKGILNGLGPIESFKSVSQMTGRECFSLFFSKFDKPNSCEFIEDNEIFKFGNNAIHLKNLSETQNKIKDIFIKLETPVLKIQDVLEKRNNALYFEAQLDLKHFVFKKISYEIFYEG